MTSSRRTLDHLVVVVSEPQQQAIDKRLAAAGFPPGDFVVSDNLAARAYLAPIHGGGFLEICAPSAEVNLPKPAATLRETLAGIATPQALSACYTTLDPGADLDGWRAQGLTGAFAACGAWRSENGAVLFWTAIFPQMMSFEPFFYLQERRLFPLPYLEYEHTAPRVSRIVVRGGDADLWRQRHTEWFGLRTSDGIAHAGDTQIVFETTSDPGFRLTFVIDVPRGKGTIPLVNGGSIELV
jgi:hypothetical protein